MTDSFAARVTVTVTVTGTGTGIFGAQGLLYSVVTVTDRPIVSMGDY